MAAYYNELDKFAAAWLRELIKAGHIAPGDVDERSIEDVTADDVRGYTQAHFFAGIGGWSYALRLAGWPDDRPVWTGSCPCQPFSSAGKGDGADDSRHLWPTWFHLIAECKPYAVFGEQVSSVDGLAWFDLVSSDLERAGYAVGALDTCAAGVGEFQIRQRLYFVADTESDRAERLPAEGRADIPHASRGRKARSVASPKGVQFVGSEERGQHPREVRQATSDGSAPPRRSGGVEWIACRDGKRRPIEPGLSPLVASVPERVGRLRGYGNAINAVQAQRFIEAYLDAEAERLTA